MIKEETGPPQPRFIAQWCRVKISKFNRESNRRLRLIGNVIDYDYMSFLVSSIDYDYSKNCYLFRIHMSAFDYELSFLAPSVDKPFSASTFLAPWMVSFSLLGW